VQIAAARALLPFDDEVVVSALEGFNVDGFLATVVRLLPQGPRYFPRDMSTDQPLEVMIAEFIREKILRSTFDEVPHAVGVAVEDLEYVKGGELARITATVFVERESQKGIIVGKGGEMIKRIGSEARADLERLLGSRVYLDLTVKVKRNWRRDAPRSVGSGMERGCSHVETSVLAAAIDQTLLKPTAGFAEAGEWMDATRDAGFASLCVSPFLVPLAAQKLAGPDTLVCSVCGFPLGYSNTETKAEEARLCWWPSAVQKSTWSSTSPLSSRARSSS
jgi:hypothetical protein